MPIKWAWILPVLAGSAGIVLLRMVGEDATRTYSFLLFFVRLNSPVAAFRLLPSVFDSTTGMFLGCPASDLNVVLGSLALWFFVGRWIDGDHRWPRGRVPSAVLGLLLLSTGGMLAYAGVEGSRVGEGREWLPWHFTAMTLAWAAAFLYAAWKQFLDWRGRSLTS